MEAWKAAANVRRRGVGSPEPAPETCLRLARGHIHHSPAVPNRIALEGFSHVHYGITTSSEMTTGLPAVMPAGVGIAAPAAGPGEPPGPAGTATPAGMPPGKPVVISDEVVIP